MKRGVTGIYVIITAGGEKVRAFVPHPLPPEPPLEIDAKRQRLLEEATLALGRLDSIALVLPDPQIFLYSYVRREAVLSSQIEGTQSSLADLMLFEIEAAPGAPLDDVVETSNYVATLEHGVRRLREGLPLCNRLLCEMHAMLLRSGRGAHRQPGEFRRSQNWIGGTRPGNAHFVPPPPDRIPECMAALERFLHDESQPYPTLIKAALAHVQFETIHPFLDGNGRLGRLLISFVLHHEGLLSRPILYLSLFFKKHRAMYYELLDAVRTAGDWEAWVDFFLEGVASTAQDAVSTAQRLLALIREDEARIRTARGSTATMQVVYQTYCRRPLQTIQGIAQACSISYPAAAKAVERMRQMGILSEITGKKRGRVFAYAKYLAILSEGTEPL